MTTVRAIDLEFGDKVTRQTNPQIVWEVKHVLSERVIIGRPGPVVEIWEYIPFFSREQFTIVSKR